MFYDIHGNLPALKACLLEASSMGYDEMVFGGDVALGFMPSETVSQLMSMRDGARFVMGNADRELVRLWDGAEPRPGIFGEIGVWAAGQLDRDQRDFLASFEPVIELDVEGLGTVLFCHGTPESDEEIITPETPEAILAEVLTRTTVDVVVGGHIHIQMERAAKGNDSSTPAASACRMAEPAPTGCC